MDSRKPLRVLIHTILAIGLLCHQAQAYDDAKSCFLYVDKSCGDLNKLTEGGKDMTALIQAAQDALPTEPEKMNRQQKQNLFGFFGPLEKKQDLGKDSVLPRENFEILSEHQSKKGEYSIWCDGSALEYVDNIQEGDHQGKPFDNNEGRWYIPPDRRAPNSKPIYFQGTKRDDYCNDPNGRSLYGASVPGRPWIILCQKTMNLPASLDDKKEHKQDRGTKLDDLTSIGAVLLHEFSHAAWNAPGSDEKYGVPECMKLAASDPEATRENADTYMIFAMASYLNKNSWLFLGSARDPQTSDGDTGAGKADHRRQVVTGKATILPTSSCSQTSYATEKTSGSTTSQPTFTATSVSISTVSVSSAIKNTITTIQNSASHTTTVVPLLVGCDFCPSGTQNGLLMFGFGTKVGVWVTPTASASLTTTGVSSTATDPSSVVLSSVTSLPSNIGPLTIGFDNLPTPGSKSTSGNNTALGSTSTTGSISTATDAPSSGSKTNSDSSVTGSVTSTGSITSSSTSGGGAAIFTARSAAPSTVSVASGVSNTITTVEDPQKHTLTAVPLLVGCAFCPPDSHSGLLLFGWGSSPGVWKPPVGGGLPGIGPITIGPDNKPTADPSKQPSQSASQTTKPSQSDGSSTTEQSSTSTSTSSSTGPAAPPDPTEALFPEVTDEAIPSDAAASILDALGLGSSTSASAPTTMSTVTKSPSSSSSPPSSVAPPPSSSSAAVECPSGRGIDCNSCPTGWTQCSPIGGTSALGNTASVCKCKDPCLSLCSLTALE